MTMTATDLRIATTSIMGHEGFSPRPAKDSIGFVIGYGWNLQTGPAMTEALAQMVLRSQLDQIETDLTAAWLPFAACDGVRQQVLLEMAYQLGIAGLLTFRHMLHAIAIKDYQAAATEVLTSRLSTQTPKRAQDYAALLRG